MHGHGRVGSDVLCSGGGRELKQQGCAGDSFAASTEVGFPVAAEPACVAVVCGKML